MNHYFHGYKATFSAYCLHCKPAHPRPGLHETLPRNLSPAHGPAPQHCCWQHILKSMQAGTPPMPLSDVPACSPHCHCSHGMRAHRPLRPSTQHTPSKLTLLQTCPFTARGTHYCSTPQLQPLHKRRLAITTRPPCWHTSPHQDYNTPPLPALPARQITTTSRPPLPQLLQRPPAPPRRNHSSPLRLRLRLQHGPSKGAPVRSQPRLHGQKYWNLVHQK